MSIRVLKYKQPLYEAFDFDDEDSVDSLAQSSIKSAKKNSYIGAFKKKVESDLDEYDDYIDMTLPENLIDDVLPEINLYLKGAVTVTHTPVSSAATWSVPFIHLTLSSIVRIPMPLEEERFITPLLNISNRTCAPSINSKMELCVPEEYLRILFMLSCTIRYNSYATL